jgi:hypothetical protein
MTASERGDRQLRHESRDTFLSVNNRPTAVARVGAIKLEKLQPDSRGQSRLFSEQDRSSARTPSYSRQLVAPRRKTAPQHVLPGCIASQRPRIRAPAQPTPPRSVSYRALCSWTTLLNAARLRGPWQAVAVDHLQPFRASKKPQSSYPSLPDAGASKLMVAPCGRSRLLSWTPRTRYVAG